MLEDNVFKKNDAWYYWDETGYEENGPFNSKQEALEDLKNYANWLEGKPYRKPYYKRIIYKCA